MVKVSWILNHYAVVFGKDMLNALGQKHFDSGVEHRFNAFFVRPAIGIKTISVLNFQHDFLPFSALVTHLNLTPFRTANLIAFSNCVRLLG